jgi:superoxide dismutase, Cu-Zn family
VSAARATEIVARPPGGFDDAPPTGMTRAFVLDERGRPLSPRAMRRRSNEEITMNRTTALFATAASALAFILMGVEIGAAQQSSEARARMLGLDGDETGTATLTAAEAGGVLVTLQIEGLPEDRWVAVHVHETGECDASTDYDSAGGHFNPASREHGYHSAGGPHAGDMPNQHVGGDGVLRAEIHNPALTLSDGDASVIGRAIVVHAGRDDYVSQPSGDAGARIACGVVE